MQYFQEFQQSVISAQPPEKQARHAHVLQEPDGWDREESEDKEQRQVSTLRRDVKLFLVKVCKNVFT